MTRKQQNWEVWRGDQRKLRYVVSDDTGAPLNLTTHPVTAGTWTAGPTQSTAQVTKTLGAGLTIEDAATGQVAVLLTPPDIAALDLGQHWSFLKLTIDGIPTTCAEGRGTVNPAH